MQYSTSFFDASITAPNKADIGHYFVAILACGLGTTHRRQKIVSPEAFNQATYLPVIPPRVIDRKARHGKKVESLPAAMLGEVMARVVTIFA